MQRSEEETKERMDKAQQEMQKGLDNVQRYQEDLENSLEKKIDSVKEKINRVEEKIASKVEGRVGAVEKKVEKEIAKRVEYFEKKLQACGNEDNESKFEPASPVPVHASPVSVKLSTYDGKTSWEILTSLACAYLKGHLTRRAKDWYDVLGYALVQGEETDYDQLKQALKESFLVVRNKAELKARFFASYQNRNLTPVDFVYEVLKLQKALMLKMTELNLIQHIVSRLEPQVQDYVEIRNPNTRDQWLQVTSELEERYSSRKCTNNVRVQIIIGKDEIGMYVGGFPMIGEIEIGGMQKLKLWIDKMIGEIVTEMRTGIDLRRTMYSNRNRIDRYNRVFESHSGQYQSRNSCPRGNFNRGDQRHGGSLNCLKVQVDQDDQSQNERNPSIRLSALCMPPVELLYVPMTAQGAKCRNIGIVELQIRIREFRKPAQFHILVDLEYPCILGVDFTRGSKIVLDFDKKNP
ncbi:uncharacterized protein TNCV_4869401 [Trichonephila clavipes]|nr:uncharacterized protein TNCV_4869401 [Trichonephila clavipes]